LSAFSLGAASFLLVVMVAGIARVVRGPTAADRMLAAQLFGTTGVAILLLLGVGVGAAPLVDVALVLALLAAVSGIVFVERAWGVRGGAE
jgi:multicomponent Na+:H+ antiporter subunit F